MGGGGNTYDYGFRIYNPNLGRFLSVDPLRSSYAMLTSYQYASDNPVKFIDLDGLEAVLPRVVPVAPVVGLPPPSGTSQRPTTFWEGNQDHVLADKFWGMGEPVRMLIIASTPTWTKTYEVKPYGQPAGALEPTKKEITNDPHLLDDYYLQQVEQRILSGEALPGDYDLWGEIQKRKAKKEGIVEEVSKVPNLPYANPGHHDYKPKTKNPDGYIQGKSVLPSNHLELWKNSFPDLNDPKTRWTLETVGKEVVIHRFQSDQPDGTGAFHWNGSSNGEDSNGTPRPLEKIPSEVLKKAEQIKKEIRTKDNK